MNQLVDYVKAIHKKRSPYGIVNVETDNQSTSNGFTHITTYLFNDGVKVEYEHSYDDGSPYPGCKEYLHVFKVIEANNTKFEGETSQVFTSSSGVNKWLES